MSRPDPNDLIIFAKVVEHRSLKSAGEYLGIPHSTVSRRLVELENQLGEKLLHRTTRTMTLTEFGSAVLLHAQQVADDVDATVALVDSRLSEPSGRLRVSIPTDFTSDMLGSFITKFRKAHPKISIEIDVSRRRVDLISENFDLAVRIGDLADDATLAARRIGTIEMGLYASPPYLSERGIPQHPDDLEQHDTLHLSQTIGEPMRLTLRRGDQTWEKSSTAWATANSPGILMNMAVSGAGIAPLADHLAHAGVHSGSLVRLLDEWHQQKIPIWAIMPSRRLVPIRVEVFIEELKRELSASHDA
jgi:DNA-binding transcriptional LysR family regulator